MAQKPEVHPKMFKWYKILKKCNPPDFKFYPSKLTNKNFPIRCNVDFFFAFLYCLMQWKRHKINIAPYGENLHYLTYWDKI